MAKLGLPDKYGEITIELPNPFGRFSWRKVGLPMIKLGARILKLGVKVEVPTARELVDEWKIKETVIDCASGDPVLPHDPSEDLL